MNHSALYIAMIACGMASLHADARRVYWTHDITGGLPREFAFAARWPNKRSKRR